MERFRLIAFICLLLGFSGNLSGAQQDSTIKIALDSTVFQARRNTSGLINKAGGISFDTSFSNSLPRLFGTADPLRYIQYLPWVQTASEGDAGIRINGCDNSQNYISIDKMPIYSAQHLFGFFSLFSPTHFERIDVFPRTISESRVGGEVSLISKSAQPDKLGGEIAVGLINAEGSMNIPIGKKATVYASARKSYMNLLYSDFLKIDKIPFKYGFADVNLTAIYRPTKKDKIQADFYWGNDKMKTNVSEYVLDFDDSWGNIMGGVIWERDFDKHKLEQRIYASSFANKTSIGLGTDSIILPSSILDVGYRCKLTFKDGLNAGGHFSWYRISPQSNRSDTTLEDSLEGDIWVSKEHNFTYWLSMVASAKGEYFRTAEHHNHWGFSPSLCFVFTPGNIGKISASGAINHQYLFQTGISTINLPLEFWLSAGKYSDPQRSIEACLKYEKDFLGSMLSLAVEGYYKDLSNQLEYDGQVLDFLQTNYSLENHLLHGNGYNWGASVLLRKNSGKFTGWLSYSYSVAKRYFNKDGQYAWYSSSHERPHEFKALGIYKLKRWDFSGTFVLASGTPYTPVSSIYMANGRLFCNYEQFNSGRLPVYLRLDLSVSYYFNDKRKNGLVLSLYNVTFKKNAIMYRLFINEEKQTFNYAPMCLNIPCLPSISYFHKF